MAFEPLYGIIQKLLRRALQLPEVSREMACNAVALWVFLDTVYPECEFQSSMVPISENPSFIILIQEAEIAVGHLMAQDSVLPANEIDQVLLLATRIVFPNKKFELRSLYVKEYTRERLQLWVTICQSFCKDLQPRPHQEAQDEMSDQEAQDEVGDQEAQDEMGDQEAQNEIGDQEAQNEIGDQEAQDDIGDQEISDQEAQDEIGDQEAQDEIGDQEAQNEFEAQDEIGDQEAQDEMGDQEDEGGIGDVDDRTLKINFTIRDPVPKADIHKYINRNYGNCIESIVTREEDPNLDLHTGAIVLKTRKDVTRVLGETNIGTLQLINIDYRKMWIGRKNKVNEEQNQ